MIESIDLHRLPPTCWIMNKASFSSLEHWQRIFFALRIAWLRKQEIITGDGRWYHVWIRLVCPLHDYLCHRISRIERRWTRQQAGGRIVKQTNEKDIAALEDPKHGWHRPAFLSEVVKTIAWRWATGWPKRMLRRFTSAPKIARMDGLKTPCNVMLR